MIDVEIIGRIKNKNKVQEMCSNILSDLLPRVRRNVEVTINLVTESDNQACGYCLGNKNGATIELARRSFGIKFSYQELMLILCHELVHAKQFIKGELTDHPTWMGLPAGHFALIDQPWEIEAFELEEILYNKYAIQE